MTHEDALRDAIAGGLAPVGVRQHIAACSACRDELESLRATETLLRSSAFTPLPTKRLEALVISRTTVPPHTGWARMSAAAALLVAAALSVAWLGNAAGEAEPSPLATRIAVPSRTSSIQYDDSTAGLLKAYEPLAAALPQVGAEDFSPYLNPSDQGGWNG